MTDRAAMFPAVETNDAAAVAKEVRSLFHDSFPDGDDYFITRSFEWLLAWTEGRCSGYLPLDAVYHDLAHTLQGTLCCIQLLHNRHRAGASPVLTVKLFELGLLAILLHDSGYLKKADDTAGTGAKYTLTHVRRSLDFANEFLSVRGYSAQDIATIQNLIRCTAINADLSAISFLNGLDRVVGCVVGTADLLGQMAAPDYFSRLPLLFAEYQEAHRFNPGESGPVFSSVADLIQNTPSFWRNYVWPKLNEDFGMVYRFLNDPYPDGPNRYVDCVRTNIAKIERQSALVLRTGAGK